MEKEVVLNKLKKYGLNEETYEKIINKCSDKVNKINLDIDWQDIIDKYNLNIHYDTLRKNCTGIFGSIFVKEYYESKLKSLEYGDEDPCLKQLELKKKEIEREKIKLRTEKLEYNRWLREDIRNEMIVEKIVDAISQIQPLSLPPLIQEEENQKEYLLCFGDEHYGAEFELKDLLGNVLNSYSPEIFETRMNSLLSQTIDIIKKENIKILNIFSLGDFADGILRVSQLMKLRYGVVDSTIKYAEYMSNWFNTLSNYVKIKIQFIHGNHTELRMISQPKGTFVEDNMGKVMVEFIRERLKNNYNFEIVENPTGIAYLQLCNHNVLGIHGEVKNMTKAIDSFSRMYGVNVDYLIAGHLHHSKSETIGINQECINVPSIVGCDNYSLSLQKTSNAGATLLVFENTKGKICEYSIKLS